MNTTYVRSAAALLLVLSLGLGACSKGQDTPQTPSMGIFAQPQTKLPAHLAYVDNVAASEGSSSYFVATKDLNAGDYKATKGLLLESNTMPYLYKGCFFTFPNLLGKGRAQVGVYSEQSNHSFRELGAYALPGNSGTSIMCPVSETKAYLANWNIGSIDIFNPSTLQRLGRIDLNEYAQKGARVTPADMIIRDGYLFVGLNQIDATYMPVQGQADLAIIDIKTDKVLKVISDKRQLAFPTRPFISGALTLDEQGDIYVNCLGTFGMGKPELHAGLLRIRKGQLDFDTSYILDLSKLSIEGSQYKAQCLSSIAYIGQGKALAYATINELAPDYLTNPYQTMTQQLVELDLYKQTLRVVPGLTPSKASAFALVYDGGQYVYVAHSDTKASGIVRYDVRSKQLTQPFITTLGEVSGITYVPEVK